MTALQRTVLKHPGSAYFIVAFVALCCTVVVRSGLQALIYLLPLAGAFYVGRTATVVDENGITARAMFGSQLVPWAQLRGLWLADKGAVYAVNADGTRLRLPCVRGTKLGPLIVAGGGRIPDPSVARPAETPETARPAETPATARPAETPEAEAASDTGSDAGSDVGSDEISTDR